MRTWQCWILAVVVTLGSAIWQRMSGPTYPVRARVEIGGELSHARLLRSGTTGEDLPVRIPVGATVTGEVAWRRFPSNDTWQMIPMSREGGELVATLATQPAAGKLEYQVLLHSGAQVQAVPERPAVARFKDHVPELVLVPHILAMFLGMLFAARAGIEAAVGRPRLAPLSWAAFGLVMFGGFALGPLVQKFAFDAWWTGVPFGWDLTDNKTLLAGIAWALAVWQLRSGRQARAAVLIAAIATLVVFAIPHSVWGSQIDWSRMQ
ncbi:MAG TPA: hypothetical protein PLS53_08955 [Thermoanaerobaculaceae bacterium]|nr:hypothetical protein [Thermoanaerobaculaceae bacterium]HPS78271.1 hypothetical protein [Thermoanaerobaculaceae bacterium]